MGRKWLATHSLKRKQLEKFLSRTERGNVKGNF
jgi:hypothetical protein